MKTLILNDQELDILRQALGAFHCPHNLMDPLIRNIGAQIENQARTPPQVPAADLPVLTEPFEHA